MKETTRKLLEEIDQAHDWREGQVYGGQGTTLNSTDVCRICSLRRHWHGDTCGPDEYRFSDGETGADLSLRQAHARGCAEVTA